ncbi:hypothetical protein HanIR_Chr00c51g0914981 [Helianthus annuus]|nr:hypothetical protein HanIR_Chr00c51g0914981 [Helianthus annuus]
MACQGMCWDGMPRTSMCWEGMPRPRQGQGKHMHRERDETVTFTPRVPKQGSLFCPRLAFALLLE